VDWVLFFVFLGSVELGEEERWNSRSMLRLGQITGPEIVRDKRVSYTLYPASEVQKGSGLSHLIKSSAAGDLAVFYSGH